MKEVNPLPSCAIDEIINRIEVRSLKEHGIRKLVQLMERVGFLDQFPLLVRKVKNGYQLLDGAHRFEAAKVLGLESVPISICDRTEYLDCLSAARRSNEASETLVVTNFVDDAELVWRELASGRTQQQLADVLGWSRSKVADYNALQKLDTKAWELVVATFELDPDNPTEDRATEFCRNATNFSEGLLRNVLSLKGPQQVELCAELASGTINKGKFKKLAKAYAARNEMEAFAAEKLAGLPPDYLQTARDEIRAGAYDRDWDGQAGPNLLKLCESFRDQHQEKSCLTLLYGDFLEEAKQFADGSIDAVITDGPYNISWDETMEAEGKTTLTRNKGDWDSYEQEEKFRSDLLDWSLEWKRLLKVGGNLVAFCADKYIGTVRDALHTAGLTVRGTRVWCKSNPGPQPRQTLLKPATEFMIWATNGDGHCLNFTDDKDRMTYVMGPTCQGHERIKDHKGNTLHPTQKPEWLIEDLIQLFTHRGDLVFDGFMGVGTTPFCCKKLGRKAIGIDQDARYHDAAVRRCS